MIRSSAPALGLLALGLVGCGGAATPAPRSPRALSLSPEERAALGATDGPVEDRERTAVSRGPLRIERAGLLVAIDEGLGAFLRFVRVTAVVTEGRFRGFRFDGFRDPDGRFAGVPLEVGDVVESVNGLPIERPEQALAVWNGLRVTSEVLVVYRRGSVRRELRIPIVDGPTPTPTPDAAGAAATEPAAPSLVLSGSTPASPVPASPVPASPAPSPANAAPPAAR